MAGLIATGAAKTQVVVVSHAQPLLRTLDAGADELALPLTTLVLRKEFGETTLDGQGLLDRPLWRWPNR